VRIRAVRVRAQAGGRESSAVVEGVPQHCVVLARVAPKLLPPCQHYRVLPRVA
jgi:hypothetical protein